MANRLIELLGNREKAEVMGKRGRQVIEEKFSTAAQLEKTLSLYDRLLNNKKVRLEKSLSAENGELVK
jgi:glycosyltransferase involved in cell wall biosynthesis